MNVLAVIPARSGSTRIKDKNKQIVGTRTLVQHAQDCALGAKYVNAVVVSSDDIMMIDRGTLIRRPEQISGPTSDIAATTKHALERSEHHFQKQFDYVVTLQPTVPMRTSTLLDSMISALIHTPACNSALTMVPVVPWLWRYSKFDQGASNWWSPGPYPRSQDCAHKHFQEINAIQISTRAVVMAEMRWKPPLLIWQLPPWATFDVDDDHDLARLRKAWPFIPRMLDADPGDGPLVFDYVNHRLLYDEKK